MRSLGVDYTNRLMTACVVCVFFLSQLLLLNGISVDYAAPPHLGRNIEFPCTLYVNVACQSNNPLALAALLQRGAATLDAEFVDWQLANNNTDAVSEVGHTPES